MHDAAAVATMTVDDLAWILTIYVHADGFCDGYLEDVFDTELITRVATRAGTLLASQHSLLE